MVDFTQFFSPAAWGSWNQPNQSMVGPKPVMPMAPGAGAPGMAQPGVMPTQPGGAAPGGGGGGNFISDLMSKLGPAGNPLMSLLSGKGGGGNPAENPLMSLLRGGHGGGGPMNITPGAPAPQGGGMMSGISGNPMLAKFGGALMSGQNPMQAMMSNPGDFAKWAAQRRAAQPGANPVGVPQPPVPTQNPGMLGGLY